MSIELISTLIGLILTLMVFSYLIGDNLLFRLAINLFIGVASGYAVVAVFSFVLLPKLRALPLNDLVQLGLDIVPFLLGITLFAKLSPRTAGIGSFAMALLVGVGAATAISGAVIGTLIPQVRSATDAFTSPVFLQWLQGGVMLLGTVFTLAYFQFSATRAADGTVKRNIALEGLAWLGRIFIAITFGVLFAGVYMAALTAMIERLSSMVNLVKSFFSL